MLDGTLDLLSPDLLGLDLGIHKIPDVVEEDAWAGVGTLVEVLVFLPDDGHAGGQDVVLDSYHPHAQVCVNMPKQLNMTCLVQQFIAISSIQQFWMELT